MSPTSRQTPGDPDEGNLQTDATESDVDVERPDGYGIDEIDRENEDPGLIPYIEADVEDLDSDDDDEFDALFDEDDEIEATDLDDDRDSRVDRNGPTAESGISLVIVFAETTWAALTELAKSEGKDPGTMLRDVIVRERWLRHQQRNGYRLLLQRGRRLLRLTSR